MKRIALLGFIVFVVPVMVVSCYKDECNFTITNWTFSKLTADLLTKSGTIISENDTIYSDTIYFRSNFSMIEVAKVNSINFSSFSALACTPSTDFQKNKIQRMVFALKSNFHLDTSVNSTLFLEGRFPKKYYWQSDKEEFIKELSYHSLFQGDYRINGKFKSPKNSQYLHFVILAIKYNGDTLTATSPKIFCK